MPRNFTSPVGRLVQGDAFVPQTTDQQGRPRVIQSGPNAGQPAPQFFVGVAFAKGDPAWQAFKAEILAEAALSWPQLFPQGAHGPCVLPTFASKIIDGDGFDTTGKPNSGKEGFAGHEIVRFTSGFAPNVFRVEGGAHVKTENPADLKRGYFVRIAGNVTGNGNAQKPGLYVNFNLVEITAYGPEIVSGPSASEAFGAPPAALPPGASMMPTAPAAPMPPGAAVPAYVAPPVPVPVVPVAPAAAVAPPYTGYVTPPPAPAAPVPPPPPAAPVRVMLPAAQGASYEAMIANGWTDATLIANGMMAS